MAVTSLRKARVLALQVLYEVDSARHLSAATLERALPSAKLPAEALSLAHDLVQGVDARRRELDEAIARHAPEYPVEQLSVVERNILRIAIFEILMNNRTPSKVAINEAVELAKAFGSLNIHRFINGVLGSVLAGAGRSPAPVSEDSGAA